VLLEVGPFVAFHMEIPNGEKSAHIVYI